MNHYLIVYDLGTGGIKASLYRTDGVPAGWSFLEYSTNYPASGWHEQRPEDWWHGVCQSPAKLLAGCAFRAPLLTNLLSVVVFGGIAYELANWHPVVPAGFWDYTQMIVRFSLVLILISTGVLFWSLSLARLEES